MYNYRYMHMIIDATFSFVCTLYNYAIAHTIQSCRLKKFSLLQKNNINQNNTKLWYNSCIYLLPGLQVYCVQFVYIYTL